MIDTLTSDYIKYMNICNYIHVTLHLPYLVPCDAYICNGVNAVCKTIYGTNEPKCTCPEGMIGDPEVACGKLCLLLSH